MAHGPGHFVYHLGGSITCCSNIVTLTGDTETSFVLKYIWTGAARAAGHPGGTEVHGHDGHIWSFLEMTAASVRQCHHVSEANECAQRKDGVASGNAAMKNKRRCCCIQSWPPHDGKVFSSAFLLGSLMRRTYVGLFFWGFSFISLFAAGCSHVCMCALIRLHHRWILLHR